MTPEPRPAGRRREAWGHHDDGERRCDPPHLVDWPSGTYEGRALCGKPLKPLRLDPAGTARRLDGCAWAEGWEDLCTSCAGGGALAVSCAAAAQVAQAAGYVCVMGAYVVMVRLVEAQDPEWWRSVRYARATRLVGASAVLAMLSVALYLLSGVEAGAST